MTVQPQRLALAALAVAAALVGFGSGELYAQACPPTAAADGAPEARADADEPTPEPSVRGRVRDADGGIPISGARVDLRSPDADAAELPAEVWTDADGRFRACGLPDRASLIVSAAVGDQRSPEVRTTVGSDRALELLIPLPSSDEATGLLGTVREEGTDRPVTSARVRLPGLGRPTSTGPGGTFVFEELPPGSHPLEITHLSYGTATDTVHLLAGRPLQMRFSLAPAPIRIAGVEAAVRSRSWLRDRAALHRRMEDGFGDYITRDEIVERGQPPLHLLLGSLPGVEARSSSRAWGSTYYPVTRGCGIPRVFVDGVQVAVEPGMGVGIDDFQSADIDVVEVYKGPGGAPPEYSGVGATCGVILIWTRAPG